MVMMGRPSSSSLSSFSFPTIAATIITLIVMAEGAKGCRESLGGENGSAEQDGGEDGEEGGGGDHHDGLGGDGGCGVDHG